MSTIESSYYETLNTSLEELRLLCQSLKSENLKLKNQVRSLQKQVDAGLTLKNSSSSGLSEVDKIALRNQISSYIKRIDQILEAE